MQNFAFRKLFETLGEKLARLEAVYEEKILFNQDINIDYLNACRKTLDGIKKEFLTNKKTLLESYTDNAISAQEIDNSLTSLTNCAQGFLKLHSLLKNTPCNEIMSEIPVFIDTVLADTKLLFDNEQKVVILTDDYLVKNECNRLSCMSFFPKEEKSPLVLYLPTIESKNPLNWLLLINQAIKANISALNLTMPEYKDESLLNTIISDLISLKVMGPAYYCTMIEAETLEVMANLGTTNISNIAIRERILFNKLEKSDLFEKFRNTHASFEGLKDLSEKTKSAFGFNVEFSDSLIEKLNVEIDKTINKSLFFNKTDLNTAITAYERLLNNVFISSSYNFDLDEVRKEYERTYNEETFNIYEHINKLNETPNTPQQITNAGWIYREHTMDHEFYELLNSEDFENFKNYTQRLNNLLVKSIELSVIHKILLKK